MNSLARMLRMAELSVPRVGAAVGLGVLAACFGVALMAVAGYLISRAAEHPPILSLTITIVFVRFFALSRPVARYFERLAAHDLSFRALGRVRAAFFRRIEPLAPAQLDGFRRGDLLGRMVGDVDALQGLYSRGLGPPLVAPVAGALCVVVATVFVPAAGLILAGGLLVGGLLVPGLVGVLARRVGRRQSVARAEFTADLVESIRGASELVVCGRGDDTLARLRDRDRELVRLGGRDAALAGLGDALSTLVAGVTTTGVLAAAVAAHDAGALDRVLVVMLALLALASAEIVAPLPTVARDLSSILASGRRVLELLDREPVVRDPREPVPLPDGPVAVALEGVSARYSRADDLVLTEVDLRLEPGAKLAVVGPNGAGKSTITNVLLRFLDPAAGRVTLAGRDARQFTQDDVRRKFALAGQQAHVFSTTIRANLTLARPAAGDGELEDALRRAGLFGWVAGLPDGMDTLVGEEGTQLSGGQRQRLTLARALLADAPILILDEPTAHVDPATAERLMTDIFAAARDRTILLITHRPEGLELADEVVTLDEGQIVGTGSRAEL